MPAVLLVPFEGIMQHLFDKEGYRQEKHKASQKRSALQDQSLNKFKHSHRQSNKIDTYLIHFAMRPRMPKPHGFGTVTQTA